MSFAAAPRRPVDVFADVVVDTPAGRIAIAGEGATVAVAADRLETLRAAARRLLGARADRTGRIARVAGALHASGIRVSVRVRSREIARTGSRTRSGLLSRTLGLPGVEVRPVSLLLACLGARR